MFDVMYNIGEGSHYIRESDGGDRDHEGFARRIESFSTKEEAWSYIYEGWRPKTLEAEDARPSGPVFGPVSVMVKV